MSKVETSHVKHSETERCRYCCKTPCKREGGLSCHARYMRTWRKKKRLELEALQNADVASRMRAIREKIEQASVFRRARRRA